VEIGLKGTAATNSTPVAVNIDFCNYS